MITIFHGDDTAASRKYFIDEKNKAKDTHFFDGEKISLSEIVQIFEGEMLFSQNNNIFIENFFGRKGSGIDDVLKIIEQNTKTSNIYFWEEKELAKKELSIFKNPVIKLFKYPQCIFLFLDSIKPASPSASDRASRDGSQGGPGNGKTLIQLFHKTIQNLEIEIIFYMIIRQFRLLLALSDPKSEQIDEVKRLAPWQREKLERQSKLFSFENLKNIYKKLGEIDANQKTGNLNLTLEQAIDMLLINL